MTQKVEAKHLPNIRKAIPKVPVIGLFATSDPRLAWSIRGSLGEPDTLPEYCKDVG